MTTRLGIATFMDLSKAFNCVDHMAVARGVQGGALAPPPLSHLVIGKKLTKNTVIGWEYTIVLKQFVNEIITYDPMCFFISSFKNISTIGDFIALHCCIN